MRSYSLAIAWNWEFDQDFIEGIERECSARGISTYRIDPHNLQQTIKELQTGELSFRAFYDRASDADPAFLPLVYLLSGPEVYVLNPHTLTAIAADKATMHLELISHGINVPYTVVLSPFNKVLDVEINPAEFSKLGNPFVIKPANTTGGGTGVVLRATNMTDVIEARQLHKDDKYLLQETILPRNLDGKRGWFRAYYAFGEIIPCWWDDLTHMYTELYPAEEEQFGLQPLRNITQTIQDICRLDFFSTEIAFTDGGRFIVVDYVNEVCDMRLKSKFHNGAPDAIVHRIERLIAERVELRLRQPDQAGSISTG